MNKPFRLGTIFLLAGLAAAHGPETPFATSRSGRSFRTRRCPEIRAHVLQLRAAFDKNRLGNLWNEGLLNSDGT